VINLPFAAGLLFIFGGIFLGLDIAFYIGIHMLNKGHINKLAKMLGSKKMYAEVTLSSKPDPPKSNPDLYYHQPPDKKAPNK
jgi:hypothetical protein